MRWKSVGAVAGGIGVNFLAVPVDLALHFAGIFPAPGQDMSDGLYSLALSYRVILAILGGYATARLAPAQPMKHAMILGAIGLLFSSAGAGAMWGLGHHWYPLSLVAICLPASWFGARISGTNTNQR